MHPTQVQALAAIIERFEDDGALIELTVTGAPEARATAIRLGFEAVNLSVLGRAALRDTVKSWAPDLLIWMNPLPDSTLLAEADRLAIPRVMIDAGRNNLFPQAGWRPGRLTRDLNGFARLLCTDRAARARLIRLGAPGSRIEALGPLRAALELPHGNETLHRELIERLANRPVWLAAELPGSELTAVLGAYRLAMRRMTRLMLAIAPKALHVADIADHLTDLPFKVASRMADDPFEETVNIILMDRPDELPEWYRVAPVTYMGGTLSGLGTQNPLIPAALGSAVIHGPRLSAHSSKYRRLTDAGASCAIRNRAELGETVEETLAPDRAAQLALGGWEVTSEDAVVSHRVHDLIRELLGWRG